MSSHSVVGAPWICISILSCLIAVPAPRLGMPFGQWVLCHCREGNHMRRRWRSVKLSVCVTSRADLDSTIHHNTWKVLCGLIIIRWWECLSRVHAVFVQEIRCVSTARCKSQIVPCWSTPETSQAKSKLRFSICLFKWLWILRL